MAKEIPDMAKSEIVQTARHKEVLIALRKIIRAIDLYSKLLSKETGLTAPQLLVLQALADKGEMTMGDIARELSLSQATITIILDRLEKRDLLVRKRGQGDKRRVYARLTNNANAYLAQAPKPLQADFLARFSSLRDWEQSQIISCLEHVASMMNADDIDAAPLLDVGAADRAQPTLTLHEQTREPLNKSVPPQAFGENG
jgi:DNA-binding MarR family transcriptional regulator